MRYIPVEKLKEGMVLGLPFHGSNFEVLLTEGMELNQHYIQRIEKLGYPGLYIEDKVSRDVVTKPLISDHLKHETMRSVRGFLHPIESGARPSAALPAKKMTRKQQREMILPLVQELIMNKHRLVDMVDLKPFEDYSVYHTANVVVLSLLIGLEIGVPGDKLYDLGMAALVYDLGNAFIPKEILNKPGRLTSEEYEIVKSHSEKGFAYIRDNVSISIEACMGALQHHEHYDGTGYPNGLKRDKISIFGRIISVADVLDALTSRRPFRPAMTPAEAMSYIHQQAGTRFDPDVVRALSGLVSLYPAGSLVELNTGAHCIVLENFPKDVSRPRLRRIGGRPDEPEINLHTGHPEMQVVRPLEGSV